MALELLRERVMRDTERRLAGDVLAEALTGRVDPDELRDPLAPVRVGERAAVLIFQLDDAAAAAEPLLEPLQPGAGGAGGADARRAGAALRGRSTAPTAIPWSSPQARHGAVRGAHGDVRAATSRPAADARPAAHLPRGSLRARGDRLRQRRGARGGHATRTSARSSCCSPCRTTTRCALYCDEPPRADRGREGDYGDELMRSLEAFIDHNGQWERAARQLYCHRHTLRYRIQRIEELTGRDLSRARDRIEFWLALRGRELVGGVRVAVLGAGGTIAPGDRARPGGVRGGRGAAAARHRCARAAEAVADAARRRQGAPRRSGGRRRDGPRRPLLEDCDVLVNSASYRINLDGDARLPRRPAATTSISAGSTTSRREQLSSAGEFERARARGRAGHRLGARARPT